MHELAKPDAEALPELFAELEPMAPSAQSTRIEQIGASRPALAETLRRLLHVSDTAGAFLDRPFTTPALPAILHAGTRLGAFLIDQPIASGTSGVIYRATGIDQGATVAIKVRNHALPSRDTVSRFQREVDAMARLSHPGIVRLIASGFLDDGARVTPWIAMEMVEDARDLHTWARGRSIEDCVAKIAEACDAVHDAHLAGIVHRDLKPANLLVCADGRLRVIDFGIATVSDSTAALAIRTESLTPVGAVIGTFAYMSPEQREASDDLDARTDIYALGVILYELYTGSLPFRHGVPPAEDLKETAEEAGGAGSPARRRHRALAAIIMQSIETDRAMRHGSAAGLAVDLRCWLRGDPAAVRGEVPRLRPADRSWRKPVIATVAVTAAIAATLLAIELASRDGVGTAASEAAASESQSARQAHDALMADAADTIVRGVAGAALPADEEADRRMIAAHTYEALGRSSDALEQYRRAFELSAERIGATSPETLTAFRGVARALQHRPEPLTANEALREQLASTLREVAAMYGWWHRETVDACAVAAPVLGSDALRTMLASVLCESGNSSERATLLAIGVAELAARGELATDGEGAPLLDETVRAIEDAGRGEPGTEAEEAFLSAAAELADNLAHIVMRGDVGDRADASIAAEAAARRIVAVLAPLYLQPDTPRSILGHRRRLALAMRKLGDPAAALAMLELNLQLADASLALGREAIYSSSIDAARLLAQLGRSDDAGRILSRAAAIRAPANEDRRTLGWQASALAAHARHLRETGRGAEALEVAARARGAAFGSDLSTRARLEAFDADLDVAEQGVGSY